MTQEHFGTGSKKGRGMAQRSLALIEAMYEIAEVTHPITGRGIGYKLFAAGLIPSMELASMRSVYRLLKEAREQGAIPWEWIVDETRDLERASSWDNPEQFLRCAKRSYRRNSWAQQPARVLHGFSGATTIHDDDCGRCGHPQARRRARRAAAATAARSQRGGGG